MYSIVLGKSQFKPVEHTLDMRALLHDNEVLSFGFDDFNSGFSQICVQAKNLSLYIIDFTSKRVVRRIRDPVSVSFKGIFYDFQNQARHLPQYDGLKEFIQAQEAEGNTVMVPKLNPDFVAVQQGKSRAVKIFSLKTQTFLREFTADSTAKRLEEYIAEANPVPELVEVDARAKIKSNVERRQQNIWKNEELEEEQPPRLPYLKPWVDPKKDEVPVYAVHAWKSYLHKKKQLKRDIIQQRQRQLEEEAEAALQEIKLMQISP